MLVGEEIVYTFSIFNPETLANTGPISFNFDLSPYFSKTSTTFNGTETLGNGIPPIGPEESAEVKVFADAVQSTDNEVYNALARLIYFDGQVTSIVEDPLGVIINEEVIPLLTIEKSSVSDEPLVGDIITYELNVLNDGTVDLLNIMLIDPLDSNVKFISGSVKVGGLSEPDADIISGFLIGDLAPNENVLVTFEAEVISDSEEFVTNITSGEYEYIPVVGGPLESGSAVSNEYNVRVYFIDVPITKTAVPSNDPLMLGDTVEYTVTITNNSEQAVTDVNFIDNISNAVVLNPQLINVNGPEGSVVINNPNLQQGVNIGDLKPGEKFIITYTAEVVSGICSGKIVNDAYALVNFTFKNQTVRVIETEHVSTAIDVGVINFNQISSEYYIHVPSQKPDIEEINDINTDIVVSDSYVIKNLANTSNEGQILSGYKLIVHGEIVINVIYTALNDFQSNHSFSKKIPFSKFIILPEDYKGQELNINNIIENVDVTSISERTVCFNIVYMLVGEIC